MKYHLLSAVALTFLAGCSFLPRQTNDRNAASDNPSAEVAASGSQDGQSDAGSTTQNETQAAPSTEKSVLEMPPETPSQPAGVALAASQSPEVALAAYLKQTGAVLYDAENCTYCRKQQRLFGPTAFQELKVVNCGPWDNPYPECRQQGIRTFPTWEIGGRRYPTILPLQEIAEISGFDRASRGGSSSNVGAL